MTPSTTQTGVKKMNTHEIAQKHNVEPSDVQGFYSHPMGRGVIRVNYVKIKRTFHVYDDSDNSEGYTKVVGENAKQELFNKIQAAA